MSEVKQVKPVKRVNRVKRGKNVVLPAAFFEREGFNKFFTKVETPQPPVADLVGLDSLVDPLAESVSGALDTVQELSSRMDDIGYELQQLADILLNLHGKIEDFKRDSKTRS